MEKHEIDSSIELEKKASRILKRINKALKELHELDLAIIPSFSSGAGSAVFHVFTLEQIKYAEDRGLVDTGGGGIITIEPICYIDITRGFRG